MVIVKLSYRIEHMIALQLKGPVPYWKVPLGRRDGKVSILSEALTDLPPAFSNIAQLKALFASKGLSVKDLVVLSGNLQLHACVIN